MTWELAWEVLKLHGLAGLNILALAYFGLKKDRDLQKAQSNERSLMMSLIKCRCENCGGIAGRSTRS